MITIIFGKPGFGKTALNTYFAVMNMIRRERYMMSCNAILDLNSSLGRKLSLPPLPHIVFSNYTISDKCRYSTGKFSYLFDPFKFSLPNEDIEYAVFPPYSSFHITEGQRILNSRKSKQFRACVSGAYENHRHIDLDIYIDMQRPKLADANVRELVQKFICVLGMSHKMDDVGRIVSTTWNVIEFEDWSAVDKYISYNDCSGGINYSYTFEGNIFDCYNSKCNRDMFYIKWADFNFKYIPSSEAHTLSLVAPYDFYEKG